MSAILRWFNDGEVRYRAYFRADESGVRQLIVASRHGQCVEPVPAASRLEDLSHADLLAYARRVRLETQDRAHVMAVDAAAD